MLRYIIVSIVLLLSVQCVAQQPLSHTVYFGLDKSEFSVEEKNKLSSWLNQFTDTLKRIEIVGHTDYLDSEEYNLRLSERRANSVVSYLENNSTINYRMSLVSAKGEELSIPDPANISGNSEDRRVDITVIPFEKTSKPSSIQFQTAEEPESETDLLERATVGQTIVLKNLNFFPGRHFLIPQAMPELERLIGIMMRNSTMEIEIQGHICCKLDSIDARDVDTKTYSLSQNRAQYIHDQLVLAGVDSTRMKYRGFAGSRPLYNPEITARHRNANRRVEIKVLKK